MEIEKIAEEYSYKTELHAHSAPVSRCGKKSPAEVVRVYTDAGCDSVVITNHCTENQLFDRGADTEKSKFFTEQAALKGCKSFEEFYLTAYYEALEAAKETELSVILGAEVRFSETVNDYLVYGICPNDIEKLAYYVPLGIEAFYSEFIKNGRAILMHAHPFRDGMEPTPLGFVDGIEVFNTHPGHNSRIAVAARFASEHNMRICGGSDYHEEGRHATCLMRTRTKMRDSYDVAEAIRSQDIIFDIFGNLVIPRR